MARRGDRRRDRCDPRGGSRRPGSPRRWTRPRRGGGADAFPPPPRRGGSDRPAVGPGRIPTPPAGSYRGGRRLRPLSRRRPAPAGARGGDPRGAALPAAGAPPGGGNEPAPRPRSGARLQARRPPARSDRCAAPRAAPGRLRVGFRSGDGGDAGRGPGGRPRGLSLATGDRHGGRLPGRSGAGRGLRGRRSRAGSALGGALALARPRLPAGAGTLPGPGRQDHRCGASPCRRGLPRARDRPRRRRRLPGRAGPRPERARRRRTEGRSSPRPGCVRLAPCRASPRLSRRRPGHRPCHAGDEHQSCPQDGRQMNQILCDNLVKIYKIADLEVVALQGLDLMVEPGEFIAVVGASGSGKSTLQNILGGMDTPTAGKAEVAGFDLTSLTPKERTIYRRRIVGFLWQQTTRNLLPYLDGKENVELPLVLEGMRGADRREYAGELLALVGMSERASHRPDELSGGEQQRVAIAIALANRPKVLFADEPTGELDTETAGDVFATLRAANRQLGVTVVLTHDPLVSEQVDRTIAIRDGRTSSETLRRSQIDDLGEQRVIAEEFAVLDRAGRLQLPAEYVDALELERRVRLELEPDHIGVWPDRHDSGGERG